MSRYTTSAQTVESQVEEIVASQRGSQLKPTTNLLSNHLTYTGYIHQTQQQFN